MLHQQKIKGKNVVLFKLLFILEHSRHLLKIRDNCRLVIKSQTSTYTLSSSLSVVYLSEKLYIQQNRNVVAEWVYERLQIQIAESHRSQV